MRIAPAASLQSRDGTLTKDAKVLNGLIEVSGEGDAAKVRLRKRPGLRDAGLVSAGAAQLLAFWNGLIFAGLGDTVQIGCLTTTWSPSDKGSTIGLSGGNLIATAPSTGYSVVRSAITASQTWYAEFTFTAGAFADIGMANSSHSLEAQLGSTDSGVTYRATTGQIVKNNVVLSTPGTYTVGDVIGIRWNSSSSTIEFYKNDVLKYTVSGANMPAGALYFAFGAGGGGAAGTVTANFGAVAFTYTSHQTARSWISVAGASLTPVTANLPFSTQDNGANSPTPYLMVKSREKAWVINTANVAAAITDADYPGAYSVTLTGLTRVGATATATAPSDANFQVGQRVTIAGAGQAEYNGVQTILSITPSREINYDAIDIQSITRSGTTATVTTRTPHGFLNAQSVIIGGAEQAEYNGTFTITWISATQFSYTVTVSAGATLVSPATGTFYLDISQTGGAASVSASGAGTVTVIWPNHGLETGATVELTYNDIAASGIQRYVSGAITVVDANSFTLAGTITGTPVNMLARQYLVGATISSITGSGTTATVTMTAAHHITVNNRVYVAGAAQAYYNTAGSVIVTVTGATTFTYEMVGAPSGNPVSPATGTITVARAPTASGFSFTFAVSGTPATPATGTITATTIRYTVPGIAYIDGYFVVMDEQGVLYNSAEDDPSLWNALEFQAALAEAGAGMAIARSLQYVIAFKEWSTEYFFDAANEVGSPLSPVPNLFTLVGCASGYSLAEVGGKLLWISQSKKQKGRGVHMMMGSEQQKVSTVDIDRILNADDLADVDAMGVTLDGHPCYVLRLGTTGVTLVYDMASDTWLQFTSNTLGSAKSVTSITLSGTTATVAFAVPHTLSDGDPVLMAGAGQSEYNGIKQAAYVSPTVITYEVSGSPASPATGTITGTPYTESYFKFTKYASCAAMDLVLHKSDGHIYELSPSLYQDAGLPINLFSRSPRLDGETERRKKMARLALVCNQVSDSAMVRWSDDDNQTFAAYRAITLSDVEPNIRRCGGFQRRTLEYRHIGNVAPIIEAIELEVSQ